MNVLAIISQSLEDGLCSNINNYHYVQSTLDLMSPNHQIFKHNRTITHICVYSDNIDIVKMVLNSGGDPDIKDNDGITPTDLSIMLGRSEHTRLFKSWISYN